MPVLRVDGTLLATGAFERTNDAITRGGAFHAWRCNHDQSCQTADEGKLRVITQKAENILVRQNDAITDPADRARISAGTR